MPKSPSCWLCLDAVIYVNMGSVRARKGVVGANMKGFAKKSRDIQYTRHTMVPKVRELLYFHVSRIK